MRRSPAYDDATPVGRDLESEDVKITFCNPRFLAVGDRNFPEMTLAVFVEHPDVAAQTLPLALRIGQRIERGKINRCPVRVPRNVGDARRVTRKRLRRAPARWHHKDLSLREERDR